MPSKRTSPPSSSTAVAPKSYFSDPFADFGDAASQIPSKLPVCKIEYLASESTQREHPDWVEGKFSINIGEQLEKLTAGLIGMRYGRVLWPEDFDPKAPERDPLCRSDNGLWPSGGTECPKSDVKATVNGQAIPVCVHFDETGKPVRSQSGRYVPACPLAKWGDRHQAPICKDGFVLLLWEHTLNIPMVFTVKGTGIKHISQLKVDMIRFQRELPESLHYPPAAYCKLEISILKVQRWYEPQFTIVGTFDEVSVEMNADAMQNIRPTFENMTAEEFEFEGESDE